MSFNVVNDTVELFSVVFYSSGTLFISYHYIKVLHQQCSRKYPTSHIRVKVKILFNHIILLRMKVTLIKIRSKVLK